jgi:hypothetical protein
MVTKLVYSLDSAAFHYQQRQEIILFLILIVVYRQYFAIKFTLLEKFRPALGPTWSPIQWVPGAILPGPKHPGHKYDHSFPSSAKVKNEWSFTTTPPCFHNMPMDNLLLILYVF